MPLQTQTWAQSGVQSVAGSGDTVAEVLVALKTLIDADSNWNVGSNGTAASPAYLEIVSAAGMGDSDQIFKLLLVDGSTTNAAWTLGGTGNWAAASDYDYAGGNGAQAAEDLYVGYCAPPSDGTSATAALNTGNIFNATGPYGGTADSSLSRFSSYVKAANNFGDTANDYNCANVWILTSAEMICIVLEDAAGRIKFILAGAYLAPLSDAAGETVSDSIGRIFGMAVPQSFAGIDPTPASPTSIFWGNITSTTQANGGGFAAEANSNANTKAAQSIALCHYPEDNTVRPTFGFVTGIASSTAGSTVAGATGCPDGALLDTAGNLAALPFPMIDGTVTGRTAQQLVGIMRQVKITNNSLCRSTVQDGAGATVGYIVSGSRTAVSQGFLFSNS
jgi:hypothetical protein